MWLISRALAVLLAVAVALTACLFRGPDLAPYERFREPALVTLPPQKVLVLEAQGAPGAAVPATLEALKKTYAALDGVPLAGPKVPAPRTRWPKPSAPSSEEWVGLYALPVPDSVTAVPLPEAGAPRPSLATWEYGEVAQILHVGPYDTEGESVKKLKDFIAAHGLEIAGPLEAEHLRGPPRAEPDGYWTLLRFPVKERSAPRSRAPRRWAAAPESVISPLTVALHRGAP
jgi:effector-binding domain-containing protein